MTEYWNFGPLLSQIAGRSFCPLCDKKFKLIAVLADTFCWFEDMQCMLIITPVLWLTVTKKTLNKIQPSDHKSFPKQSGNSLMTVPNAFDTITALFLFSMLNWHKLLVSIQSETLKPTKAALTWKSVGWLCKLRHPESHKSNNEKN